MKPYWLLVLFITLCFAKQVEAQERTFKQYLDSNKVVTSKVERYHYHRTIELDKKGIPTDTIKTYYLSGHPYEAGVYQGFAFPHPTKRIGEHKRWHVNGQLKALTYFNDQGKADGWHVYWNASGQCTDSLFYKDGKRSGINKSWYNNGQLEDSAVYEAGKLNGLHLSWYNNGNLRDSTFYLNSNPVGLSKQWYKDGARKSEKSFGAEGAKINWNLWYENQTLKRYETYTEEGSLDTGKCFTANGKDTTFFPYEVDAEFPGGQSVMMRFISDNMMFPTTAIEDDISGKVIISFVVKKDGILENAYVLSGVRDDLNDEALRVIKMMPKWTPGMRDGKRVAAHFNLPIAFRLY